MHSFFSWQHAVLKSKLEPTTKLVCHTIGCHMALDGSGCFPSYALIAEESGLSRSTVMDHVKKAVVAGFLVMERRERENGSQSTNIYRPAVPGVVREPDQGSPGARLGVVREPDAHNTSFLTTQFNTPPVAPPAPSKFGVFWNSYPLKVGKPKALSSWNAQKLDAVAGNVLAGLERWKASSPWKRDGGKFIPHPTTFLNQRRWEDCPEPERALNPHAPVPGEPIPF
ncbi:helix-turn-helix domain-containing protein [Mesorhizobium sp. B2-3-4]|nr:helix-turn-helix domain-containing protein [Mesorhizobium sp. B2-3-4]